MSARKRKLLQQLKPLLLRLSACRHAGEVKKVLSFASDKDLDRLLSALHFIVSGSIDFPSNLFETLVKKRVLKVLRIAVEHADSLKNVQAASRNDKLEFFKKLSGVLQPLSNVFIK